MNETKNDVKKKDMKDVFEAVENIRCVIQKSLKFVDEFLSEPMCGRCLPCSLGSYEALIRLKRVAAGVGDQDDVSVLQRIADEMLVGSMCKKGKDTAKFLMDALKTDAYAKHLAKYCRERECLNLMTFRIIAEKCVLCGLCQDACRYNAILGEKKAPYLSGYLPFEIRQNRCVKCGDCLPACPYGAIEIAEETEKTEAGAAV